MLGIKSVIFDDRIENWSIADSEVPHHILIFMISGKVTYWLNGEKVMLKKGDVLFISGGTFRSCDNDPEGPHQKYSAHFQEFSQLLQPLLENPYLILQIRNSDYFKQRFSMLLLEWFDRGDGHDLICEGIMLELLGLVIKSMRSNEVSVQKQELVNQLQTYILHNHCKPLRLTDLADHVQRSPNHITKIFRQVLHQTPIDYIHQVKTSIAYEMLRNNRLTVAEVSDHLGYCEQSYFHRIFKKFTGIAPSAVQKGNSAAPLPPLPSQRA
ncbi:helix-turn-helix domain-containing protein [Paenibacillus sp. LMG 31460]|uniref:Helix-turn-helix domain-containing protein n=1 Tax=Paenibacillus germinis TaxID=2654979 RepID=A0ABX1Z4L2_9BACL|nr:helix-turn-helix domain-containing protein [Paenibacillus germinis]NOU87764.1 helix-turn-helix domain-containing protein [Paenibacillus germinis]